MSERLRHMYELYIRTTPEKLWDTITRGELTKQYFYGGAAHSDWRAGSRYELVDEDGKQMLFGDVIESDPPRKLVHTFNVGYDPVRERDDPPSRVTWEIERMGEVCKLTLFHEHFAGETKTSRETLTGWNPVLSGLKTLLETGRPLIIERPAASSA
ncbi:MAG: SRPBCC family protein [bacterium]|nr:SRPBCC family protein [bacterium]